uniref:Uncharacterized protein n=1 Tax=Glossina palpalis gambiensis TaxID=67801 RepID=A0A1B0BRN0_9MUSC
MPLSDTGRHELKELTQKSHKNNFGINIWQAKDNLSKLNALQPAENISAYNPFSDAIIPTNNKPLSTTTFRTIHKSTKTTALCCEQELGSGAPNINANLETTQNHNNMPRQQKSRAKLRIRGVHQTVNALLPRRRGFFGQAGKWMGRDGSTGVPNIEVYPFRIWVFLLFLLSSLGSQDRLRGISGGLTYLMSATRFDREFQRFQLRKKNTTEEYPTSSSSAELFAMGNLFEMPNVESLSNPHNRVGDVMEDVSSSNKQQGPPAEAVNPNEQPEIGNLKKERYTEVKQSQIRDADGAQNFGIAATTSTPNQHALPQTRVHRNDSPQTLQQNQQAEVSLTSDESTRRRNIDVNRWHLKFDGSGKGLTVEIFILASNVSWCWQLFEDHEGDTFGYLALKEYKIADFDCELPSSTHLCHQSRKRRGAQDRVSKRRKSCSNRVGPERDKLMMLVRKETLKVVTGTLKVVSGSVKAVALIKTMVGGLASTPRANIMRSDASLNLRRHMPASRSPPRRQRQLDRHQGITIPAKYPWLLKKRGEGPTRSSKETRCQRSVPYCTSSTKGVLFRHRFLEDFWLVCCRQSRHHQFPK